MAETEERPSKIRKLIHVEDDDIDVNEVQHNSEADDSNEEHELKSFPEPEQSGNGESSAEQPKLSKSQQKKLAKKQQWEAGKEYRKVKRREQRKEKQARKAEDRANGVAKEDPKIINVGGEKKIRPRRPLQTPVGLILDCDFEKLMSEKELISLGAQLTRCYSENRSSPFRAHMVVSSFGGALKERFETVLQRYHEKWKGVKFYEEDFMEAAVKLDVIMKSPTGGKLVGALTPKDSDGNTIEETKKSGASTKPEKVKNDSFPKAPTKNGTDNTAEAHGQASTGNASIMTAGTSNGQSVSTTTQAATATQVDVNIEKDIPPQIIYLTADSAETLSVLEPNTSYIVGGIVDKNRYKGLCYKRACERDVRTAKLPIGEYMTMQSRSVLTVNHVVEIMLKWLETGDWGEAFMRVLPKRKEAKLKVKKEDQQEGEQQEGDDASEDEDDEHVGQEQSMSELQQQEEEQQEGGDASDAEKKENEGHNQPVSGLPEDGHLP